MPHHEVAVGLVYNDAGELLIHRRPDEGLLGGLWEFPSGRRQGDEPLEHTCQREVRAALGIDIEVRELFSSLAHAYSHFKITAYAFCCYHVEGTPYSASGQPWQWASVDSLQSFAFPRVARRLVEQLHRSRTQPTLFD